VDVIDLELLDVRCSDTRGAMSCHQPAGAEEEIQEGRRRKWQSLPPGLRLVEQYIVRLTDAVLTLASSMRKCKKNPTCALASTPSLYAKLSQSLTRSSHSEKRQKKENGRHAITISLASSYLAENSKVWYIPPSCNPS